MRSIKEVNTLEFMQYEHSTLTEEELKHYGKKGMKWRVRHKKKGITGNAKAKKTLANSPYMNKNGTYKYGSKDAKTVNALSQIYGHQALNERLKAINSKMGAEAKRVTWDNKLNEKIKKKREEKLPWNKKR